MIYDYYICRYFKNVQYKRSYKLYAGKDVRGLVNIYLPLFIYIFGRRGQSEIKILKKVVRISA